MLDRTLQNHVSDGEVGDLDKILLGEGVVRVTAMNAEPKEEWMTNLDILRLRNEWT